MHGIEPLAHLDSSIPATAHDPRSIEPMVDLLGSNSPAVFTKKLNL